MIGRGRRELGAACLLTAVGGLVMLSAAGRNWAAAVITQPPLPPRRLAVTGAQLGGSVRALALVALAGVAALVALRGWWRTAGGVVLVAAGIAGLVAFGHASPDGVRRSAAVSAQRDTGAMVAVSGRTGWPYVYAAGAAAVAVAGGMAAAGGSRWPALGARYDAPAPRSARPADPWAALDRGEDPTVR
jgi:uncharacterized membrane protein (TIGR02234 family)